MRFSVLASGSGGNSCYVEAGNARVLIDAGLSCREIERRLGQVGVRAEGLDAIIITHEHTDHIRGAGPLARRYDLPLFINHRTFEQARNRLGVLPESMLVPTGESLSIKDLIVETFTKCHDAADPIGLVLSSNGSRIGFVTDLGRSTRLVEDRLKECQALIMEFNYDPDMLDQGPYPLHLKRRIKGPDGHLSNQDAGALLRAVSHLDLRFVVLAHLSETNNHPDKADQAAKDVLDSCGLTETRIVLSRPDEPAPMIEL